MRQRGASFLSFQDVCVPGCLSGSGCSLVSVADRCILPCLSFVYFMYSPIYLCPLICVCVVLVFVHVGQPLLDA